MRGQYRPFRTPSTITMEPRPIVLPGAPRGIGLRFHKSRFRDLEGILDRIMSVAKRLPPS